MRLDPFFAMSEQHPLEDPNPPVPDSVLQHLAAQPCDERNSEENCPQCLAKRELERRGVRT
jgi:hypothetical protein